MEAVGGRHAQVLPGEQGCANLGYIVDDLLYHPGDALAVPDRDVQVACLPVQASWLNLADAASFAQALHPARTIGIHDGQLNDRGVAALTYHLTRHAPGHAHLQPGSSIEI